jgi:hypothetical protein
MIRIVGVVGETASVTALRTYRHPLFGSGTAAKKSKETNAKEHHYS